LASFAAPHHLCLVPENIHTPTTEGHWKFGGRWGVLKAKFLNECMSLNWKFSEGWGVQTKKSSVGRVWMFSGLTQIYQDIRWGSHSHVLGARLMPCM